MRTVDLHYTAYGSGPPMVLLHPIGLDSAFWDCLIGCAARTHRVLSLDLRGHGRSPAAKPGLEIADYAADVHAAIERHCDAPAVVLGISFGGMIAQHLTVEHPQDVAALIAGGCPGRIPLEAAPAIRERGLLAERGGMKATVDATIERWFTVPFHANPAVQRVRARLLNDEPSGWSAGWHAIARFDCIPRLPEITVPTLVVAGEKDVATPVADSKQVADAISGSTLTILSGAPHMMHIECAKTFATTICDFVAGLPRHPPR
jgi:3-oxoadipate enol-lactonase